MRSDEDKKSIEYVIGHLRVWLTGEDISETVGVSHLDIAYARIDNMRWEHKLRKQETTEVSDHDPS